MQEVTQPQETQQEQPFVLDVKYNKEEIKLDREKAVEYAQKGMNYDKKLEELETTKKELEEARDRLGQIESSELWRLGNEIGGDPLEGGKVLYDRHKKAADLAASQEQGITVEEARAQREAREDIERMKREKAMLEKELGDTRAEDEARQQAAATIAEFREAYPDVDLSSLPDEVGETMKTGVPLIAAYKLYELQRKVETMEQATQTAQDNAANAAASTGKIGGGAEHVEELTEEQIDKMTPAEREKNHSRIWAYLTNKKE